MKTKIILQLSSFFVMLFLFYAFDSNKKTLPDSDDDKPAEEVYKNIRVLKGMPKKDLSMVMQFMRASLGVSCAFCHVHNESTHEWNFESDSIEEKSTAREMINMVKSINKDHFEGNNAVTCFTCHRGKTNIVRTPDLPQMPPVGHETRDTTIPKADLIIDNYLKAP